MSLHHPSASLSEAFSRQAHVYRLNAFDNAASYGYAIAILIGSWTLGCLLGWLVWYLGTFNWKRLFCGRRAGGEHKREDNAPLLPLYNDHNESANKPRILPVTDPLGSGGGVPRLIVPPPTRVLGEPVGTVPPTFKSQPVVQTVKDSVRWHGHPRTRYESYLRLVVMVLRVGVMVIGIITAFQAAGVNILSLAASLGIVAICFSLAAQSLLSNILSAIYMYGTDKIEMRDYIQVGSYFGVVTALRGQWTDITNDLSPWMGRQIHQLTNTMLMNGPVTVYPDGPPLKLIKDYLEELDKVNEFRRDKLSLPPITPIDVRVEL